MSAIQCEFLADQDDKGPHLTIRFRQIGRGFRASYLLSEVGESLLHSPDRIVFDFSQLPFLDSSCLGAISNIAEKSRIMAKKVRFQLPAELVKDLGQSSFLERLNLE